MVFRFFITTFVLSTSLMVCYKHTGRECGIIEEQAACRDCHGISAPTPAFGP